MFYPALGFAFIMGIVDVLALFLTKQIYLQGLSAIHFALPMLLFSLQPLIFFNALNYANLTVMNILFDLSSNIIVTFVGVFLLKEVFSRYSALGLILSFVAIFFFLYDDYLVL